MYLRGTPQREGATVGEGGFCSVWSLSWTTSKWTAGSFPFQNRILESESAMRGVLWGSKCRELVLLRSKGRRREREGREGGRVGMATEQGSDGQLEQIQRGLPSRVSTIFIYFLSYHCLSHSWETTPLKRVTSHLQLSQVYTGFTCGVAYHTVPPHHLLSEQFLIPSQHPLSICNDLRQDLLQRSSSGTCLSTYYLFLLAHHFQISLHAPQQLAVCLSTFRGGSFNCIW